MICDRCRKETVASILSMFNLDMLCLECKQREEQHPLYKKACDAEREAVKAGNGGFPGIGKPSDL